MDYVASWNTSQTNSGVHKGNLTPGSVTVGSLFYFAKTDEDAIQYAKDMSIRHDNKLLSVSEVSGYTMPHTIRNVWGPK